MIHIIKDIIHETMSVRIKKQYIDQVIADDYKRKNPELYKQITDLGLIRPRRGRPLFTEEQRNQRAEQVAMAQEDSLTKANEIQAKRKRLEENAHNMLTLMKKS